MDRNFSASNAVSTATVVNVTASSVTAPLMIETKHQSESFSLMCCEFLKKQRLVDLTLSSRSRSIQVHKIVLASRSDYFEEEFAKNPLTGTIVINWLDDSILLSLVEYMYCGKIVIAADLLGLFIQSGRYLRISGIDDLEYPLPNANSLKLSDKCKFTPPLFLNKHQIKAFDSTTSISDSKHSPDKKSSQSFTDSEMMFSKTIRKRGRPKIGEFVDDIELCTLQSSTTDSTQSVDLEKLLTQTNYNSCNNRVMTEIHLPKLLDYSSHVHLDDNRSNSVKKSHGRPKIFYESSNNQFYEIADDDLEDMEECDKAVQDLILSNTDRYNGNKNCMEKENHNDNIVIIDDKDLLCKSKDSTFNNALRSNHAGNSLLSQTAPIQYETNTILNLEKLQHSYGENSQHVMKRKRGRPRKIQQNPARCPALPTITYYDLAK